MDEGVFICLGVAVLVALAATIPLSIVAVVLALRAIRQTQSLARQLKDRPAEPAPARPPAETPRAAAVPPAVPLPRQPAPPPPAAPVVERPTPAAPAPPPPPPPRPPVPALRPGREPIRWEEWIGLKGLALAGIVVVLIGAALFAAYAHEQGWFGRRGYFQTGLLTLGGLIFLTVGEVLERRRFGILAQVVTGGGLAMEYFAVYAAWGRFHLIPEPAAWIFMTVITGVAIVLAVRYSSLVVAVLSLVGGLAGPLLIRPDRDPGHVLFLYLVAVNAGVLILAYFKKWRVLNLLALAGTVLNVVVWVFTHYYYHGDTATEKLPFIVAYMTVLWGIYFALSIVYHLLGRRRESRLDLSVTIINVVAYFGGLYALLRADHHHWLGPLAVVLGAIYLAEGLAVRRWAPGQMRFVLVQVAQALGLATLAIPIQLEGVFIPMAWAAEAAVLCWLGLRLGQRRLCAAALVIHVASLIALGYYAQEAWNAGGMLVFNARTATFGVVALAMALSAWLYRPKAERGSAESVVVTFAAAVAHALLMLLVGVETYKWHEGAAEVLRRHDPANLAEQMAHLAWVRDAILATGLAVYGLVAVGVVAALRRVFHHAMALVAFAACFVVLLIVQGHLPPLKFVAGWNEVGATFAGVAACLAVAAAVSRYATRGVAGGRDFAIAYELLALAVVLGLYLTELGRAQTHAADADLAGLEGPWLVCLAAAGCAVMAGLVMLRGFWVRSLAHRAAGLALAAIAVGLLGWPAVGSDYVYETILWHPRGVAFGLLVLAMALAVVGYARAPARTTPERACAGPVLAVIVHVVVLVCFTLEAQDFWDAHAQAWFPHRELDAWYARHATLSVGYAAYALALLGAGIRRRSKLARVVALVILGGTLAKVGLLDLSRLEAIWRIFSFVGLGLLLLAASLLYHKYRHIIFPAETPRKKETPDETA